MQIQKDKYKIKGRPLRSHIKSLLCERDINGNTILLSKYSSRERMTNCKGRSGNSQNTKSFFKTFNNGFSNNCDKSTFDQSTPSFLAKTPTRYRKKAYEQNKRENNLGTPIYGYRYNLKNSKSRKTTKNLKKILYIEGNDENIN